MWKLDVFAAIATIISTLIGIMAYVGSIRERNKQRLEYKTDDERYAKLLIEVGSLQRDRDELKRQLAGTAITQARSGVKLISSDHQARNGSADASSPEVKTQKTNTQKVPEPREYYAYPKLSLNAIDNIITFFFVWGCIDVIAYGFVSEDYYIYVILIIIIAVTRLFMRDWHKIAYKTGLEQFNLADYLISF